MKNDDKGSGSRKAIHPTQHNRFCRRVLPALIASCFVCSQTWALPIGGQVVTGPAVIGNPAMKSLTINNISPVNPAAAVNSIITWKSFSIGAKETTTFIQAPASRVLNRVTGTAGNIAPSEILGTLRSGQFNGNDFVKGGTVYLINPNGIMFGAGSQVNVGGLVASTLNMTDADFLAGKNNFSGSGSAGKINVSDSNGHDDSAKITTVNGGRIYLIAPDVTNAGILTSPNGEVVLAAGHSVMLANENNPDLRVVVSAPGDTAVNLGKIAVNAGKIGIYGGLLNLACGVLQADSVITGPYGEIILKSSQGSLNLEGTISAANGTLIVSASSGNSCPANITQSDSFIAANLSAVAGNGNINLTNSHNVFSTVAASAGGTGNIKLRNSGNTNAGYVSGLIGITATGAIDITSGGRVATTPEATITGPELNINAQTGVGSQGSPLNTSVGKIYVRNANGGDIAISNTGVPMTIKSITQGNNGSIFVDTDGKPLSVDGDVTAPNGDIGLLAGSIALNGPVRAAGPNGGTLALEADGDITQTLHGPITADRFSVLSHDGSVTLNNLQNYVGTAEGMAGPSGAFSFKASNNYSIDTIPLVGSGYSGGHFIGTFHQIKLVISGETVTKVYDGTTVANPVGGTVNGVPDGHTVTLVKNGATFATKNVGADIAVTTHDTVSGANFLYVLKQQDLKGSITPKQLTIKGSMATDKVYDGNTIDPIIQGALYGVVAGDSVMLAQTGLFANKNAGSNLPVSITSTISGSDAGNYTLAPLNPEFNKLVASITPAMLTIKGSMATDKVYDGNTIDPIIQGALYGVIAGDSVTLAQTGLFASKNAGSNLPVSITSTISGSDAGNYTLAPLNPEFNKLVASITPAMLTIKGSMATDKVYDGNTIDPIIQGALYGVVAGDSVMLAQTGLFASKNAGSNLPVSITSTISGSDAGNYTLAPLNPEFNKLVASITPAMLTIKGSMATDKVYDGNTIDPIIQGALYGVVAGDSVTLAQTGLFANKNAGSNLPVSITSTISGSDAGNYTLAPLNSELNKLIATITPAPLTITGVTTHSKVVDGTTVATVTGGTINGVIPADSSAVGLTSSGAFVSPNVGNNIPVNIVFGLSGAEAGNYIITNIVTPVGGFTADILPAGIGPIGPLPDPNYLSGLDDKDGKSKGAIKNEDDKLFSCS